MKNVKVTICLTPVVLFVIAGVGVNISHAEPVIDIYSNTTIEDGYSFAGIFRIYDSPPENTTVTFNGGYLQYLNSYDNSTVIKHSGEGYNWYTWNNSTFLMNGGTLSFNQSFDYSTTIMNGGQIGGRASNDNSTFVLNGGDITYLHANGFSTVTLNGGHVDSIIGADQSVFNVYGSDLFLTSTGARGYGYVSGKWRDSTPFEIALFNEETYAHVVLHEIPEPATLSLLAIGGVALLRRRR